MKAIGNIHLALNIAAHHKAHGLQLAYLQVSRWPGLHAFHGHTGTGQQTKI